MTVMLSWISVLLFIWCHGKITQNNYLFSCINTSKCFHSQTEISKNQDHYQYYVHTEKENSLHSLVQCFQVEPGEHWGEPQTLLSTGFLSAQHSLKHCSALFFPKCSLRSCLMQVFFLSRTAHYAAWHGGFFL